QYAFEARNNFDPSRPTSLLYEKRGDDYKLIGVMYTAKKDATEDQLNERVPLSIAEWQAHVNLCLPPRDKKEDVLPQSTKFGLRGSIATKEDCDAAGGKFYPQVFGWMVHVYPFEQKAEDIWSVERQHNHMDYSAFYVETMLATFSRCPAIGLVSTFLNTRRTFSNK